MKNRRIVVTRKGGPEVFQLIEDEIRQPIGKDVCVRILAAGVSFADVLMREGVYQGMPDFPFTPGYDIVGTVESVGENVSMVKKGDYVSALSFTGGYADYIILPQNELVNVPTGVDPAEAVSLVLNYVTAYQMMQRMANLKKGDCILVHGAAGGVGTALLQIGKLMDLQMVGTASLAKHDLIRKLDAVPVDYKDKEVLKKLRSLQPDGYNAVFDGSGEWGYPSYKLLTKDGILVIYGISGMLEQGRKNFFKILKTYLRASIFLKNLLPVNRRVKLYQITKMKLQQPELFRKDLHLLFVWLQNRKINPVIAMKRPLTDAAYCHEQLNHSKIVGKIVLINE